MIFSLMKPMLYLDGDEGGGAGSGDGQQANEEPKGQGKEKANGAGKAPADFKTWLATLPEEQQTVAKSLYDKDIEGLRNTVQATRTERDTALEDLKKIEKTAEDGSALKQQLQTAIANGEEANRKATFVEESIAQGCRNPKAAYAFAVSEDLFDKRGNANWTALKEQLPEVFGNKLPPGNAGDGGDDDPKAAKSMDNFIRAAAGRS